MSFMEWNDALKTGVYVIDEQHEKLVELINKVYEIHHAENPKSEDLLRIIYELAEYTKYHFSTEEKLMKEYGYYPGDVDEHIKEHRSFVNKVIDFYNKFKAGKTDFTSSMINFLRTWLRHHILNIDKKFARFLIQKGY